MLSAKIQKRNTKQKALHTVVFALLFVNGFASSLRGFSTEREGPGIEHSEERELMLAIPPPVGGKEAPAYNAQIDFEEVSYLHSYMKSSSTNRSYESMIASLTISYPSDFLTVMEIKYNIFNGPANRKNLLVTIRKGPDCEEPGGKSFYNKAKVRRNPFRRKPRPVIITDENGDGSGIIEIDNGASMEENEGHVIAIYNKARLNKAEMIACGVLRRVVN